MATETSLTIDAIGCDSGRGEELNVTTRQTHYKHIECVPGVVGGEPVIKGTRVPVRSIVILHQTYGTLDRVGDAFPRVTEEAAREALAYYESHREEIDGYIAEEEELANNPSGEE